MSNGNDLTKESRINTLKETQEARKEEARNRVYQAIEKLQKLNAKINFHTVSREAHVSVSYLYKYPELKQYIGELRSQQNSLPVKPVTKTNSTSQGKVITRLQEKIRKVEAENKELKCKCEALAGQVYRAHHLQAQIERLQQENEDLKTQLGKQAIAKKVTPIDKKHRQTEKQNSNKSTFQPTFSETVKEVLDELGIELNTTLTKTIKGASEDTVLAAIEAVKHQLERSEVDNPGGLLNKAIKEGWIKPEPTSVPSPPKPKIYHSTDDEEKKTLSSKDLAKLSNLFKDK